MNIDFKPFILVSSRGSRGAKGAKYARGTTRGAGGAVGTILRRSKRVLERSTTGGEGETEESEVLEVEKEKGKEVEEEEVEEEEVEEVLISSQSQRNLSQQPFRNQPSLPSTRQSSPSRRSSTQQSQPSPSTTQQSSQLSNIIDREAPIDFEQPSIDTEQWSRSDTSISRHSTPAIDPEISPQRRAPPSLFQIEKLLDKQGKQIRALYELQKDTNSKITAIQKKLTSNSKNTELSIKVFNVSNII